jgi:transcriptional regulator with XRE-family HTH domain
MTMQADQGYEALGRELRRIRKARWKRSAQHVANDLGVSINVVYGWERARSRMGLDDLVRLADYYDDSTERLFSVFRTAVAA